MIHKTIIRLITTAALITITPLAADAQNSNTENNNPFETLTFRHPEGWRMADPKVLPKSVKVMVIGKGDHNFPPSINFGTDQTTATLKEYLKNIKEINVSQGAEWKDLGTIRTDAGEASLSQVDSKTEWGDMRMMHVILIRNNQAYILTAAALKEEFPKHYKEFFNSMRSLNISNDVFAAITDPNLKTELEEAVTSAKKAMVQALDSEKEKNPSLKGPALFDEAFASEEFQEQHWIPLETKIKESFQQMGDNRIDEALNKVKRDLQQQTTGS